MTHHFFKIHVLIDYCPIIFMKLLGIFGCLHWWLYWTWLFYWFWFVIDFEFVLLFINFKVRIGWERWKNVMIGLLCVLSCALDLKIIRFETLIAISIGRMLIERNIFTCFWDTRVRITLFCTKFSTLMFEPQF